MIGEGHFGQVFKVKYNPETDMLDGKYFLPFPKGDYALKIINIKTLNEELKFENVLNEKNIL